MGKSLCRGKRISNPNKCTRVRGCKVASGTKRSFCRKARSGTKKRRNVPKKRRNVPKKSPITWL